MDGFAGFKTATTEELPEAVTVMDPFHVVRLAGEALNECRRRVQQELHGHRGRKGDPLTPRAGPCTPALTCSPNANNSGSTHSSRVMTTSRSNARGASTSGSSPPTATPTAPPAAPRPGPSSALSPPVSPSRWSSCASSAAP